MNLQPSKQERQVESSLDHDTIDRLALALKRGFSPNAKRYLVGADRVGIRATGGGFCWLVPDSQVGYRELKPTKSDAGCVAVGFDEKLHVTTLRPAQPAATETDKEVAIRAFGGPIVCVQYSYVWERAGTIDFPAKLNIETGEVTISHDPKKANRRNDWQLREEIGVPIPGKPSHFIALNFNSGELTAGQVTSLQTRIADEVLGRIKYGEPDDDRPF